jgi:5-formyltetrahydrofolate cyclo-ligase
MSTDHDREPPRRPPDPAAVRQAARAARRALTGPERTRSEARIVELVLGLPELRRRGRLALYLPTDGEVGLAGLMEPMHRRGWELHLPVVGAERSMTFRPYPLGAALVPNRHGILEPVGSGDRDRTVGDLDVVIVPCVALDRDGHRLGFGAGFYDRALAGRPPGGPGAAVSVAVAFECQMAEVVPQAPWDVPMDLVVTEAAVVRPAR